jgi:hypothetical protein
MSTGSASAGGSSSGAVAGSARRKITRPSSMTPIGPRPGLSKASSDDVCDFVTSSAVKILSDMNTIVPQPRDSAAAATRTAPARFPVRPIRARSTCASRR